MDKKQFLAGLRLQIQAALKSGVDPVDVVAILETQKLNVYLDIRERLRQQPLIQRADATQIPQP